MFAQTLKSVVKVIKGSINGSVVTLDSENDRHGRRYKFTISKDKIVMVIAQGELEGTQVVDDIEMLSIPPYLNVTSWHEVSFDARGEVFEEQHLNLHYEAQLFVRLFRLMRERAQFSMKLNDRYVNAYYVDGKVLYIEETDNAYEVIGTDLYHIAQVDRSYRILNVNWLPAYIDYNRFLDDHRSIANSLGKEFYLHKPERAV